ncbi:MAG: hypothetical protein LBR39_00260 [Coriobacteriales bacterium]|jgi:hypothetical protein|nr:hypothetical protein [Coriobacteriales bacterium]
MMDMSERIAESIRLQSLKREQRGDAQDLVEKLIANLVEFYRGGQLELANITQLLWARLTLTRARLAQLGMSLDLDFTEDINRNNPFAFKTLWDSDGKYSYANADKSIKATKTYYRNGQPLPAINYTGAAHVELIEAIKNDELYVCPNCGAPSTLDSLLDGCDYCKTKFTVDDFNLKASSFSLRPDPAGGIVRNARELGSAVLKGGRRILFQSGLVVVFTLAMLLLVFGRNGGTSIPTEVIDLARENFWTILIVLAVPLGWLLFGFAFIFIASVCISTLIQALQFAKIRWDSIKLQSDFEQSVQAYDPYFSLASFAANIENKLLMMIFAQRPEDIAVIANVDPTPLLSRFAQAFDVNLTGLRFDGFTVDNLTQRLQVTAAVEILSLAEGASYRRSLERIKLTAVKSKDCLTNAASEVKLMTCDGCGASVSLLEGNTCSYCGRQFQLWLYDWVITDIKL